MPLPILLAAGVAATAVGSNAFEGVAGLLSLPFMLLSPQRIRLEPGDRVRVRCSFAGVLPFDHDGIISRHRSANGGLKVIHFDSGVDGPVGIRNKSVLGQTTAVRHTDLERFAGPAGMEAIKWVERPSDPAAALSRAYDSIGSGLFTQGTYHSRGINCQTHANYCVHGWGYSEQVIKYSIMGTAVGLAACPVVVAISMPVIAPIATALGLSSLLPGFGLFLAGAVILYGVYNLAHGLGLFCGANWHQVEPRAVRRAALEYGLAA